MLSVRSAVFAEGISGLPHAAENRRELERLNAFSDGVFAIAITLLVLNIETPNVAGDDLWDGLRELGPDISAYFIGFAVVGLFWFGHSSLFSHLRRTSGPLMFTNLLFLAFISLMPFTTSLLGSFDNEPLALAIYALNVGAAATLDSLIDQVSYRGDLYEQGEAPDLTRLTIEGILRPSIFVLSVPLAFVSTTLAQFFWLTLFLTPAIAERIARRRESAST